MVYKKAEIKNIVLNYVKELQDRIPVEKVILFGSYVYGKPTKSSDIDIAVVSQKFKKMDDRASCKSIKKLSFPHCLSGNLVFYYRKPYPR